METLLLNPLLTDLLTVLTLQSLGTKLVKQINKLKFVRGQVQNYKQTHSLISLVYPHRKTFTLTSTSDQIFFWHSHFYMSS